MPGFRANSRGWPGSIVIGAVLAGVLAVSLPVAARAQSSGDESSTGSEPEPAIEWNFRPQETPSREVSGEDLEERWAAPFAVESRGSSAPREPREVVVVRGNPALVAADSGETAAVVVVEEGEGLPAPIEELAQNAEAEVLEEEDGEGSVARGSSESASSGEAEEPAVAETEPDRSHTVTRGDTLYGIARRYGVSADAIRGANELEGDIVRLGQTLVIPEEETTR